MPFEEFRDDPGPVLPDWTLADLIALNAMRAIISSRPFGIAVNSLTAGQCREIAQWSYSVMLPAMLEARKAVKP